MTKIPSVSLAILLSFCVIILAGCTSATPSQGPSSATTAPTTAIATTVPTAAPAETVSPQSTAPAQVPAPPATSTTVPTPAPSVTPAPSPSPAASPTRPASASPTAPPQAFSGATAYEHVRALAIEIGSRPAGSPDLEQAAAYIKQQFESMGYQSALQPFDVTGFQERSSSLVVREPRRVEIGTRALALSGSGTVEGQMVYAGLGRASDFPNAGVEGKIVLMDRGGNVTFQAKVDEAVTRRAAGIVIANDRPGELRGSLSQAARVPVVGISQSDGERLKEFIRQGQVTASLRVDASISTRQGQNVVASSGASSDRKKVVIGAHYDSVPAGPGANDNASGTATILQLARESRSQNYPFDLVFVAFGDEEIGLVGSRSYVQGLSQQERSQIIAMLNFDMVGVGDRMALGGDRDLAVQAVQIAQQLGYPAQQFNLSSNQSSDHAPFQAAGIPAVFFHRIDDPNYHTAQDTADKVTAANLETAGNVALRLLAELARRG